MPDRNRWTILELPESANTKTKVPARCECGTVRLVNLRDIQSDRSKSCGCIAKGKVSARSLTHGMSGTRTYRSWASMLTRCTNPNVASFADYGARGITVCEEWRSFENFYRDMGERPAARSLDRIDPDGNYEPGNCRWATRSEQAANKRAATSCRNGHPRTEESTQIRPDGTRRCLICHQATQARHNAKGRAA